MTTNLDQPTDQPAPSKARRPAPSWALPLAGALAGLIVGGAAGVAIGAASDNSDVDRLEERLASANDRAREANRRADVLDIRVNDTATQAAELQQREAAVAAREAAITMVEQTVAANSIEEGTWTVGVDVAPGTYRTAQPVTGDCYWAITRTGSNGDIIDNDIVHGGFPSVTLSAGQDFENDRCGTFVKQ